MLAFKASLKNVKLGAGLPLSAPCLAALWDSFAVSHRRFIMLVRQSLQSEPHSCFCHLSVGNKRERGGGKVRRTYHHLPGPGIMGVKKGGGELI